ncbi:MAG: YdeI/OmpD-associated family protein [Bacilli bacterium]|nr:YdeI/OmpD-associated family protein [Bacilli bacterium]
MDDKNDFEILKVSNRQEWRKWLSANYKDKCGVWLVFSLKSASDQGITYNDAVEEALCFGWIDSTTKRFDETHRRQRFTPRRKNSPYSRPNIERLLWLDEKNMICPEIKEKIKDLIYDPYVFPEDILSKIKEDELAWDNYLGFPDAYKRIRVAYVDAARKRPEEFNRRLASLIKLCQRNKMVGYGGIDKYFK